MEKLLDVKAMYDYKEAMLPKHRGENCSYEFKVVETQCLRLIQETPRSHNIVRELDMKSLPLLKR